MNTTDPDRDDYVPAYRRQGSVLLGTDTELPTLNSRMVQLQPRRTQRPEALDRAIELGRQRTVRRRPSGHSLIA